MDTTTLPPRGKLNLHYYLLQIGFWGGIGCFTGFQSVIVLDRGFTSADVGVFVAVCNLAGILFQPQLGAWADRHPEIPLKRIFLCCILTALGLNTVFLFTRPGFLLTALFFALMGMAEVNSFTLIDAMAMQFLNAGVEVRYSLGRGLGAFAYAIVSVLAGQQVRRFGMESVLVTHAGLVVLLLLSTAAFPRFSRTDAPAARSTGRAHSALYILKNNPAFTAMLGAGFFGLTAIMPVVNFLVNIVNDRGGDSGTLGVALFLMAASELPGAVLFQWLWKRAGIERVMLASVVFMALKPLLFLLCGDLRLLLALQPIQMLGYGLFTPGNVYFANENVPPEDRVQGQSLKMVATNGLSGVVGNLLAGAVIDRGGVNAMLAVCALCGAVGVALALFSIHLKKRRAFA